MDLCKEAGEWAAEEFARRTAALEAGSLNLEWVLPEYRVSRSEIEGHFPGSTAVDMMGETFRHYRLALKRRGLSAKRKGMHGQVG